MTLVHRNGVMAILNLVTNPIANCLIHATAPGMPCPTAGLSTLGTQLDSQSHAPIVVTPEGLLMPALVASGSEAVQA